MTLQKNRSLKSSFKEDTTPTFRKSFGGKAIPFKITMEDLSKPFKIVDTAPKESDKATNTTQKL